MRRPLPVVPSRLWLWRQHLHGWCSEDAGNAPPPHSASLDSRRSVLPKVSERLQDVIITVDGRPLTPLSASAHGPCDHRWLLELLELVPAPWHPQDPSGVRRHLCRRVAPEPPVSGGLSLWPGFSRSVFVPGAAAQSTRFEDGRKEPMALAGGPDSFLHHPYYQV